MPSKPKKDLTGQVFGMLTAISYRSKLSGIRRSHWVCRCSCGQEVLVETSNLKNGNSRSCGCIKKISTSKRFIKHGGSKKTFEGKHQDPKYAVWKSMRMRCNNPKNKSYFRYGGRGIDVCPDWSNFESFNTWSEANGYAVGLQLDRKDNDKGYSRTIVDGSIVKLTHGIPDVTEW